MLIFILVLAFFCAFTLVTGIFSLVSIEERPTLKILADEFPREEKKKKKFSLLAPLAFFNAPLCAGPMGDRMRKDLSLARVEMAPETFLLCKEIMIAVLLFLPINVRPGEPHHVAFMMIGLGYYLNCAWGRSRRLRILLFALNDTIDLAFA